jgi:hypothetical protein
MTMTRSTPDHKRRLLVLSGAAALCATATGCSSSAAADQPLYFARLTDVLRDVERLKDAAPLDAGASWTWSKTLLHCAQSIDYSMTGYPEPRSPLFQHTAGAAAFKFFQMRGHMSHNLLEAIPGAGTLDANAAPTLAVATLRKSIETFLAFTGPLQPHFAYGDLTRSQYEQAHIMHIANHLTAFKRTPGQRRL